jgi:hypothetical protein
MDALFRKLGSYYGALWLDRLQGQDLDRVKSDWAEALADCTLVQVGRALDAMKGEFPPTLPEFRELCRQFRVAQPSMRLVSDQRRGVAPETMRRIHEIIGKNGGMR